MDRSDLRFLATAREFSRELNEARNREALISALSELLPRLYAHAVALRELDPAPEEPALPRPTIEQWEELRRRLASTLGEWDIYPMRGESSQSVVRGILSDDLADIERDLRVGIGLADAGWEHEAEWAWKFSFDTHWGVHALDALRAIHDLRRLLPSSRLGSFEA